MALTLTITLTDEQEAVADRMRDALNTIRIGMPELTTEQALRVLMRDALQAKAAEFEQQDRLKLRELLNRATPEDQATVKAILAKYEEDSKDGSASRSAALSR